MRASAPLVAPAVAAAIAVALLALSAGPGLASGQLVGHGTADVFGHAWGYGWVADSLAHLHAPLWDAPVDAPRGQTWWVVDLPVAVLLTPVTLALGVGAAYHAALAAGVAATAASATAWARRNVPVREGERRSSLAVVAGVLAGTSPPVRAALACGLPEALWMGLVPLLALLAGDGLAGDRRRLGAAVVLAAFVASSSPYAALAALLAVVAVAVARRDRGSQAPASTLPLLREVAPIALAVVASAALVAFASSTAGRAAVPSDPPVNPGTSWAWASKGGADLVAMFAPAPLLPPPDATTLHRHVAWVGPVLLVAAVAAARRDRAARALLAVAGAAYVLALGPWLRVGGHLLPVPLPGLLLGPLQNGWRLAMLGWLALLGAAVRGWAALERPQALAWAGAVLLEGLLLAPIELRVPTTPDPTSRVERWLAEEPPGDVLDLPLDREGRPPKGQVPQRAFFFQAVHGHPIASALYREADVLDVPTVRALDDVFLAGLKRDKGWQKPLAPGVHPPEGPMPEGVRGVLSLPSADRDRDDLVRRGFGYVTVDVAALPPSARSEIADALEAWLGDPAVTDHGRRGWRLLR